MMPNSGDDEPGGGTSMLAPCTPIWANEVLKTPEAPFEIQLHGLVLPGGLIAMWIGALIG